MRIGYIEDTETALVEFGSGTPVETRQASENVYLDLDKHGNVVSITIEHANRRGELDELQFQSVAKGASQTTELKP